MVNITIKITDGKSGYGYNVNVIGIGDFTHYNCSVEDLHALIDEIFEEEII